MVYENNETLESQEENQELGAEPQLEKDTNEEQITYESRYNKPKVSIP